MRTDWSVSVLGDGCSVGPKVGKLSVGLAVQLATHRFAGHADDEDSAAPAEAAETTGTTARANDAAMPMTAGRANLTVSTPVRMPNNP
jgi:hypothetical protein